MISINVIKYWYQNSKYRIDREPQKGQTVVLQKNK